MYVVDLCFDMIHSKTLAAKSKDLQANKGNDYRRMPEKGEGSASIT